jgi:hypothetical protein
LTFLSFCLPLSCRIVSSTCLSKTLFRKKHFEQKTLSANKIVRKFIARLTKDDDEWFSFDYENTGASVIIKTMNKLPFNLKTQKKKTIKEKYIFNLIT